MSYPPATYMQALEIVLATLILAAVSWLITYATKKLLRSLRQRNQELEIAHAALQQHFRSAQLFLEDPIAPKKLRGLVLSLSDAVLDKRVMRKFAASEMRRQTKLAPQDARAMEARARITTEFYLLEQNNPDLFAHFSLAVTEAFRYAFYMYPSSRTALFQQTSSGKAAVERLADIADERLSTRPLQPNECAA